MFVTSGTTGRPKATIGYHGDLARRWRGLGPWLGFRDGDRHLAQLPLSHGFGLLSAMAGLLADGAVVLVDRFSAAGVLEVIERDRVTVISGAPAHFRLILARLGTEPRDVGSLRLGIGTAAAFEPALVQEIQTVLGLKLVVLYGSNEGVGVATTDQDDVVRGSVGRPAAGSVAIVARTGRRSGRARSGRSRSRGRSSRSVTGAIRPPAARGTTPATSGPLDEKDGSTGTGG